MSYDPTLPTNHAPVVSAELRNQFAGLKELIDALQSQLVPLLPGLNRDGGGQWTLTFAGPVPVSWQFWTRSSADGNWSQSGELSPGDFPVPDADLYPGGTWWQAKVCGQDGDDLQVTPFSNIVSVGPVP
jgi:hypothetical protein